MGLGPKGWSTTAALAALVGALVIALNDDLRASPNPDRVVPAVGGHRQDHDHFAYALKYMRQNVEHPRPGVPGPPGAVWRDYFYLAVQVSTAFSTSDVEVTSTEMRGTVMAQSIVAFIFNTVIVALLVSALLTFA